MDSPLLAKAYLEITNICNLGCSFCHKTGRPPRLMSEAEFELLTDRLLGRVRYLYFHLMGEPTLHPHLPHFIERAREKGFLPILTTNGALLGERGEALCTARPHKVSISLHAPEANPTFADAGYLDSAIAFSKASAARGVLIALRLWNLGSSADNSETLTRLHAAFPGEWVTTRNGSRRLAERIYLEWDVRFEWPSIARVALESPPTFCHALRNHVGILVDGTVVPCCLDADGAIPLGNLFSEELEEILASPRATRIYEGFSCRRAVEPLCRTCGYATRF